MEKETEGLLNENEFINTTKRRRQLLPGWIKFFTWVFMLFGVLAPISIIVGLTGNTFDLSLYGLETNYPLSLMGILISSLFLFKGFTAFSLWMEKDSATDLAKIDSYIGLVICVLVMIVYPFFDNHEGFSLNFRFEILLLYFFLKKINNIEYTWAKLKVS
ncbi:hypothetical protein FLJC2902T_26650 [Flavobacterium limnosediminis JC2902]|uniref:Uncharacterized protein n=1 Tax=Flavobacterium limnosediminis JC2902 TaxID=1341181 RepID=V6SQL1_9FLAO|nr:hypothetical protein [Flavobacterium limnosediminis]ESU26690.1 hypothetical protein FLJC2902T_26650 [Flavobacterium limnosediminis JC2902]